MDKPKSLYETYVFKLYDKSLDLKTKMLKFPREAKHLSVNDLPRQFSDIERIIFFASKSAVMSDIDSGKVIPMYAKTNYTIPSTIPAYLYNNNGKACVVVNISNNATVNKQNDKEYNIDSKALFALLQAGTIAATCYEKYKRIKMSTQVIKSGAASYSRLFTKVLNKLYALNTVPDKLESAHFVTGLFFLVNVLGLDPKSETTIKYALVACKDPAMVPAKMLIAKMKLENFKDINTFISTLPDVMPIFKGIETKVFLDNYLQMYSPQMLLSLEYFPIFMHNMAAAYVGAYMNNQHSIEQTCGNDLDALYKAFFSLT